MFVASPSDVLAERDALSKLIQEINLTITAVAPEKDISLELVRWETHASPSIGRPQAVINSQIGEYDIFVGIMWRRFGTPTAVSGSGTEEEFERAYNEFQLRGSPQIMFYFCQAPAAPPRTQQEMEQLTRVVTFRDRLADLALVWEYAEHSDFLDTVRPHLLRGLMRVLTPSERPKQLTRPDDGARLLNLRRQLTDLAQKYARIRKELPAGDARTRQLELLATEMRTNAFEGAPLLKTFVEGATPGERLIAAIFLQVVPSHEYLGWLGDRLSEEQPFLGYHSAVALLAAARSLDCSHRDEVESALAVGLKRLGHKPGTDRHKTLLAARREIRTRCATVADSK